MTTSRATAGTLSETCGSQHPKGGKREQCNPCEAVLPSHPTRPCKEPSPWQQNQGQLFGIPSDPQ